MVLRISLWKSNDGGGINIFRALPDLRQITGLCEEFTDQPIPGLPRMYIYSSFECIRASPENPVERGWKSNASVTWGRRSACDGP